jgi:hypothetical protein
MSKGPSGPFLPLCGGIFEFFSVQVVRKLKQEGAT